MPRLIERLDYNSVLPAVTHITDHQQLARKANYVHDVTDYGAVGQGLTDDAPAIQVAINAAQDANGGQIYFPPGLYRIFSNLVIDRNVPLTFTSPGGATITAGAPDMTMLQITQSYDNAAHGCIVSNIEFDGARLPGVDGVLLRDTNRAIIRDSRILNCSGAGVRFSSYAPGKWSEQNVLDSVVIDGCGYGIYFGRQDGNPSFDLTKFYNVDINNFATTGIHVEPGTTFNRSYWEVNCWMNRAGNTGIFFGGSLQGLTALLSVESFTASGTTGIWFESDRNYNYNVQAFVFGPLGTAIRNDVGVRVNEGWVS